MEIKRSNYIPEKYTSVAIHPGKAPNKTLLQCADGTVWWKNGQDSYSSWQRFTGRFEWNGSSLNSTCVSTLIAHGGAVMFGPKPLPKPVTLFATVRNNPLARPGAKNERELVVPIDLPLDTPVRIRITAIEELPPLKDGTVKRVL